MTLFIFVPNRFLCLVHLLFFHLFLTFTFSLQVTDTMSLRRFLGYSDGEVMRSDAKPCSRLMRHTAGIFSVGGALGFWVLCRMHYGLLYFLPLLLFCYTCMSVSHLQATAFESSILIYTCLRTSPTRAILPNKNPT